MYGANNYANHTYGGNINMAVSIFFYEYLSLADKKHFVIRKWQAATPSPSNWQKVEPSLSNWQKVTPSSSNWRKVGRGGI